MMKLLERMRKLNTVLQRSMNIRYDDLAKLIADVVEADIFILDNDGVVYGAAIHEDSHCECIMELLSQEEKSLNLAGIAFHDDNNSSIEPIINFVDDSTFCHLNHDQPCMKGARVHSIWNIYDNGIRIGSLLVGRFGKKLTDEEIIICEYSATIVSIVAMHRIQIQEAEKERKRAMVRRGFDTLSYSEMEAVGHVFYSLNGKEGLLVASKIADSAGITRSVIVNALRKLESAGLIETRSLGMKGTFIKIKNDYVFDELKTRA